MNSALRVSHRLLVRRASEWDWVQVLLDGCQWEDI